jgi:hypothetical protein
MQSSTFMLALLSWVWWLLIERYKTKNVGGRYIWDMFDQLIVDFGDDFAWYLSETRKLFAHQYLKACCKVYKKWEINHSLRRSNLPLKRIQHVATVSDTYEDERLYHGVSIMKQLSKKKKKTWKEICMIDVSKISISSSIVESFFSQVKLNLTCMKNRLLLKIKTNSKL